MLKFTFVARIHKHGAASLATRTARCPRRQSWLSVAFTTEKDRSTTRVSCLFLRAENAPSIVPLDGYVSNAIKHGEEVNKKSTFHDGLTSGFPVVVVPLGDILPETSPALRMADA